MNYYKKYLLYKMKYLTLKSNLDFVNEESDQDSFCNKMKYLTLKSNLDFTGSKSQDFVNGKIKYLTLKSNEIRNGKIKLNIQSGGKIIIKNTQKEEVKCTQIKSIEAIRNCIFKQNNIAIDKILRF